MNLQQEQENMRLRNINNGVRDSVNRITKIRKNAKVPKEFLVKYEEVRSLLHRVPRLTLVQIGNVVGCTRERIRQINVKLGKHGRGTHAEFSAKKKEEELAARLLREASASSAVNRRNFPDEYQAYANAKQRCTNPANPGFKNYGGRGIQFKFTSFSEFLKEAGERPYGFISSGRALYSINRRDNNGHYEVGNLEWTTQDVQCAASNRRNENIGKVKKSTIITV